MSNPSQATHTLTSEERWTPPRAEDLELRFVVGDSVLAEFVRGHDSSAVLRELVQNEYDAEGPCMEVSFERDRLTVNGTGKPIDAPGWKRLSVVLGTGRVDGNNRLIEPKVNGLGSKNFGLRSLFLFGDTIYVRSNGLQTVLDLFKGTPPEPILDSFSKGKPGVQITVPYRTKRSDKFEPFDTEQEKAALERFLTDLTPTLIKLAQPKKRKSLRELVVLSERLQRRLKWKQSVKELPCRRSRITALRRSIRVIDSQSERPDKLEEIEWRKVYKIPEEYRGRPLPSYFKVPGGRIRIALSLRIHRKKVAFEPGLFFYPLGISRGFTGTALNINAPFEMDADRSHLSEPSSSSWNKWLLDIAVDLTFELLTTEWFEQYGPDAYLALRQQTQPATPYFLDSLKQRLSEEKCWPSRAHERHSRARLIFVRAKNIVIPAYPVLDGLLRDNRYLREPFSGNEGIREMVKEVGAKIFGANSLIRLRCAGKDQASLATKLKSGEANIYYISFPDRLKDEGLQISMAHAFDALSRRLSHQNREDLSESPTTLAADGSLKAPATSLWVVDPAVQPVCHVPELDRLHSSLLPFKTIRKLCKEFDPSKWAREVARRIQAGTASEEERSALYHLIVSRHGQLKRNTQVLLRKTPVLRDHRGHWVAPSSIIVRKTPSSRSLEPVLHFPHPDYAKDTQLARSFRFRDKIKGDDLVNYAHLVTTQPELATGFEKILERHLPLLTSKTIGKLKEIAFLRSSLGDLRHPQEVYIRNTLNQACLGKDAPFVTSSRKRLYRRLKCLEQPKVADIVAHLLTLKDRGVQPEKPEVLYPALVSALRQEKVSPQQYVDESILWNGSGYSSPAETLLGAMHRDVFLQAVPQVSGLRDSLIGAYAALGANYRPKRQHWRKLFLWFSEKYGLTGGPVNQMERRALRKAYSQSGARDALPELPEDARFLLGSLGRLYRRRDIIEERYVVDDDPELARALCEGNVPIAFADITDTRVLPFFTAAEVSTLSGVRKRVGHKKGAERQPPAWFNASSMVFNIIHDGAFTAALKTMAAHEFRSHAGETVAAHAQAIRSLHALKKITFVQSLEVKYRVAGSMVSVPRNILFDDSQIVLSWVKSKPELYGSLAQAIAALFIENVDKQRQFADAVYRLLTSESEHAMQKYLRSRGINWKPSASRLAEDDEEDEEARQLEEMLRRSLIDVLTGQGGKSQENKTPKTHGQRDDGKKPVPKKATPPLPPIQSIIPQLLTTSDSWSPSQPQKRGGKRRPGLWTPPSSHDQERDQEIGRRGEEIIYHHEIERVRALGYPESRVVWVANDDPGADHDILSVDDDGEDLWIEVKSTTGKDGQFQWSKGEFEKALQERNRYVLWRVYEADTTNPSIKPFRDPIALLLKQAMRLDIAKLYAEIEPLHVTSA